MTGAGGETESTEDIEAALRKTIADQFRINVSVSCYERGDAIDVHVDPVGFASRVEESVDDDLQVSVYSDLKLTVARD